MGAVRLRPAMGEDSGLIFAWRNDPFIVARSSSQRTVSAGEHEEWFQRSLGDENQLLLIAGADGESVGLVRFERRSESVAVISAYLLDRFTGKGFGPRAIADGCLQAMQTWTIDKVVACVREDNVAGQSGFRKAGFVREDDSDFCGAHHVCLSYHRDR